MLYKLTTVAVALTGMSLMPAAARADIFKVTGGTCTVDCSSATPITVGGPTTGYAQTTGPNTFSTTVTVGSDLYSLTGTESASYTGGQTYFQVHIGAAYVGASPSATEDMFTVDVLQNFYDTVGSSWDGHYTETTNVNLDPSLPAGSSFSTNLFYNGQAVGVLGPYTSSVAGAQTSADLTGLTDPNLQADFQFKFDFASGTPTGVGADFTESTPEPRETLPLLMLATAGTVFLMRKRRRLAVVKSEGR